MTPPCPHLIVSDVCVLRVFVFRGWVRVVVERE